MELHFQRVLSLVVRLLEAQLHGEGLSPPDHVMFLELIRVVRTSVLGVQEVDVGQFERPV